MCRLQVRQNRDVQRSLMLSLRTKVERTMQDVPFKGEQVLRVVSLLALKYERFEDDTLIFAHGFGHVQCGSCQHEKSVPYSCKGRGFCPSCGARQMAEAAIHLIDELLRSSCEPFTAPEIFTR